MDEDFELIMTALCQDVSDRLGKLVRNYPYKLHPIVLGTIQACINAEDASFDDQERDRLNKTISLLAVMTPPRSQGEIR